MKDGYPKVAIIDHSLGNMFSVGSACAKVGLPALLTDDPSCVAVADAVILPGVGAFRDAMATLRKLDLVSPIRDAVDRGSLVVGICLGFQLLMSESYEFGRHEGLGLIEGDTVPFPAGVDSDGRPTRIPQIGWNRIHPARDWNGSFLVGIPPGDYMYFLHSYYVQPADEEVTLSTTVYGSVEYTSTMSKGNIFGCQYHPERSGSSGLTIYANIARSLGVEANGEQGSAI